ncbi:MAG: hypothetical protein HZY73_03065 [Micropruina sp.]|nr:MAG: hypothetical protein HZY73_03065 [Micropruina sp.]
MPSSRLLRRSVATAALIAGLTLSGCGFDAQTLRPYNQSQGVNVDGPQVKVRNLLIVADDSGKGVVSGTLVSSADDALAGVAGGAHQANGSDAGTLTVTATALPLTLPAANAVVLTNPLPVVKVSSPGLKPGLTATLVLTLRSGARVSADVPVMSSADPVYAGIPLG